jgi:cytochrome b
MGESAPRQVVVWDLATRVFHWLLVVAVAINLFIISPRGELNSLIHYALGYAVIGLILFRIVWGFLGSPHSRFADFIHGWPRVKRHLDSLVRREPFPTVGHNPLGGWMIATLIVSLTVMVATGPFASDRRTTGPLAHVLSRSWSLLVGDVHAFVSDLLIGFVVLHVAGVALHWLVERENLVASMLHGRKTVPAALASHEPPLASGRLAAFLGSIALAIAVSLVWLIG